MVDMAPRKLAELAILENLDNEAKCKEILTDAYTAGLFTDREVNIIVADIKKYNDRYRIAPQADNDEEKDRINKALLRSLGPSVAFVLSKLIAQIPYRKVDDEALWFIPDSKDIQESVMISEIQYIAILEVLKDKGLIETKVDKKLKKLIARVDFIEVAKLYTNEVDS